MCKWRLILLHLICFSMAINTSLWQLIILSGSAVPPCCLPFGHLWPPQSPHQPSGLSRLFTGTHISHSFNILSHIFKKLCCGVEMWHLSIYRMSFFLMVYPNKGVSTKKDISGVLVRWLRGDDTRKWLRTSVSRIFLFANQFCKAIQKRVEQNHGWTRHPPPPLHFQSLEFLSGIYLQIVTSPR